MVYTDEVVNENNDTDIKLRYSDNNGATWSSPAIRVNDDPVGKSQFLPKIASNPVSGNIAICWHDCRNSASNNSAEIFATVATPQGSVPTFLPNAKISAGLSRSNASGVEFGDYLGLAYFGGRIHPAWADISNSTGDNPNGTTRFEAQTNRVTGGSAANEGTTLMDQLGNGSQGLGYNILVSLKDPAANFERRVFDDFDVTASTSVSWVEFSPRSFSGFSTGPGWNQLTWHVAIYAADGQGGIPGTELYSQTGLGSSVITPWVPDFLNASNALIRINLTTIYPVTPGKYWLGIWADEPSGRRYGMRTTTLNGGFPNNNISYVWDSVNGYAVSPFNIAYRVSD